MCLGLGNGCVVKEEKRTSLLKPYTNFEKIKKMSIDEMSNFLMDFVTEALTNPKCIVVKTWLESEAE